MVKSELESCVAHRWLASPQVHLSLDGESSCVASNLGVHPRVYQGVYQAFPLGPGPVDTTEESEIQCSLR